MSKSLLHQKSFTLVGALVTLGIVYGDIGTSPLYVMKAILGANDHVDLDYILGAISCIFWTLTLQTTLKYVLVTLRADNKGEGGILALYALVRRSKKKWLYLIAILGASTLIADGIITPSITVVSAIEGLQGLYSDTPVVPISIGIISLLFFIQQFGTNIIGKSFGPIMFVWFTVLAVLGIIQIVSFPSILYAFNPYYAFNLLVNYPNWFLILGAVFLCTTGAEALYSDLGHCGIHNIRISWAFVKVTLLLNYLGQGAWIVTHVDQIDAFTNPFYEMMPAAFLPFGVALATAAAIIASQALISGSYTIFSEAMSLNFWPRQLIKYPTKFKGQMYIPFVNGFLYFFCVLMVLIFQSSSKMEAAYGLSITITMLMTTLLLTSYLKSKHLNSYLLYSFISLFLIIEFSFFCANMFKFMHGGWVTVLLGGMISFTMLIWYNARRIKNRHMQFVNVEPFYETLSDLKKDISVNKYATNLVYISKANRSHEIENKIIYSILNKQPKRADHYWFLHIDLVDDPNTFEFTFEPLISDVLYRVNLRVGFKIQPTINIYFRQIIDELVATNEFDLSSNYDSLRKHDINADFRFALIHRVFTLTQITSFKEKISMYFYNIIKHIGISDLKAYNLETSNVVVESVPLIVDNSCKYKIKRVYA